MNDWINLDRHHIPEDILDWKIGETHEVQTTDCISEWKNTVFTKMIDILEGVERGWEYRYRRIEPKAPSRDEILSRFMYTSEWFIGRRSADIPPEK